MKLTKKYANRILRLADFMDRLPRKRFNFQHWVGKDWKGAADLSCGTTACAFGWASTMPYFRRLGLQPMRKNDNDFSWDATLFGKQTASEAATTIFGLEDGQFTELFTPIGARLYAGVEIHTPKQWAKHARRFVKKNS